jgi:prophage maintenance system killer protein
MMAGEMKTLSEKFTLSNAGHKNFKNHVLPDGNKKEAFSRFCVFFFVREGGSEMKY